MGSRRSRRARGVGRNPYEHGWKSASKMASRTSFSAACTTRSRTVGIPSRRGLPLALGIIRCRTGSGSNCPGLQLARSSARNTSPTAPMSIDGGYAVDPGRAGSSVTPHPIPGHHAGRPGSQTRLTGRRTGDQDRRSPTVQLGLDLQYPTLSLIQLGLARGTLLTFQLPPADSLGPQGRPPARYPRVRTLFRRPPTEPGMRLITAPGSPVFDSASRATSMIPCGCRRGSHGRRSGPCGGVMPSA